LLPLAVGNFKGISPHTKILGMDLIKSQKTIANTLNLRGKPERKKTTKERKFTISMAITGRILRCARVSGFKPVLYYIGRDLLFIQVMSV